MKNGPIGVQLFHLDIRKDGRTYVSDEANTRFSQFC